jgi:hypothetical protein
VRKSDLRVLNVLLEADSPAAAMKRLAERDG